MLSKFLRSRAAKAEPVAAVPAGQRVYAIGDVHGRLDLLDALLDRIADDDRARGEAHTVVVFLGDLIDRGPDSAGVVDRVMRLSEIAPECHVLLGNHEEVFLLALDGEIEALRLFTRIGGRSTILSYGVTQAEYDAADFAELLALMQAQVPERHRAFLRGAEDVVVIGDYAFVHAGIRPGTPLAEQSPKDLRWIRREFLDHRGPLEKVVVHGHTISPEVETLPHRIGLDTGAFTTGVLTAMGFEGGERWLLQAEDPVLVDIARTLD